MTNHKVLIVEDERDLADLHRDYLEGAGYVTHTISEGTGAVEWVRENIPDLIVLDLMLPGKDGLEICKEVRSFSDIPIIMVTARVEEIDKLLGLELGADDYICKPFSPREVVARVKAVMRRLQPKVIEEAEVPVLDDDSLSVTIKGAGAELTAVEYRLFSLMARNKGRIYSRDQLMDHIYTDQRIVCDRTIDSHVRKLRKKINTISPDQELIHSIYGVGYKYESA